MTTPSSAAARVTPQQAYRAAAAAMSRLANQPDDPSAVTSYVRALVALGLAHAARRVLAAARSRCRDEPVSAVLTQIEAAIAAAPSGRLPEAAARVTFERNLRALAATHPEAAERLRTTEVSRYELYRGIDGVGQVLDTVTLRWCSGLCDHRAVAGAALEGPPAVDLTAPLGFDGLGTGELLGAFLRRSQGVVVGYSPAALVIEPDAAALAVALRLTDLSDVIGQPRVRVFVGDGALEAAAALLESDPDVPIPTSAQRMPLTERPVAPVDRLFGEALERRAAERARILMELQREGSRRDPDWWRRRYAEALSGRGEPLRVLGITSRFTTVLQYSMAELMSAAERAGCRTHIVKERYDYSIEYHVPRRVREFRPDLIVMLSRLRHEFPDVPRDIPFLTWDQDALPCMRGEDVAAHLDRLTFVAGYGAWFGRAHLGWPASQALPCPPVAAAHAYAMAADAPVDPRWRCDIAFISHCSEPPSAMRDRLAATFAVHPVLLRIYRAATDELLARSAAWHNWVPSEIHLLVLQAAAECGAVLRDPVARELCMACMSLSDRAFRHAALDGVARHAERSGRSFRLYGNGWDRHPRFAPFAAGRVAFGDEFVAACRGAKLNLQLIEGGFIHSRSLDGLAAGGAFLTRTTRYDLLRPHLKRLADALAANGRGSVRQLRADEAPQVQAAVAALRSALEWSPDAIDFWLKTIPLEPDALALMPDLPRISFASEAQVGAVIERLLSEDDDRRAMAARMRSVAIERFSYDAHWRQLIEFISDGLRCGSSSRESDGPPSLPSRLDYSEKSA